MSNASHAIGSAFYKVGSTFQRTVTSFQHAVTDSVSGAVAQVKSGLNSLGRHTVTHIVYGANVVKKVADSFDGLDYGTKTVAGICLFVQLWFRNVGAPVATAISKQMMVVWDFTCIPSLINRSNVFISGDYIKKKHSKCKIIYNLSLVGKSALDSLGWLRKMGVDLAGKIASTMGATRMLAQLPMKLTLSFVANWVCIVGCAFDIVDAVMSIASGKTDKTARRHILSICNDVGKIGCCAVGFTFTYGFAALSLFTGTTSLLKTIYDKTYA